MPRLTVAAASLLAVGLLTACGDSSEPGDQVASAASAATETTASGTPTTSAPATPANPGSATPTESPTGSPSVTADQTIAITVANGKVSGVGSRERVELGSTVAIEVTSDVAEEVHLHGYDEFAKVPAGGTARMVFEADTPGVWELELEGSHKRLTQLQVS